MFYYSGQLGFDASSRSHLSLGMPRRRFSVHLCFSLDALDVGTSIARLGAALSQAIWLTQLGHPAYNVTMGTPVLVVSAIGHVCYTSAQRMWQERKAKKAGIEQD